MKQRLQPLPKRDAESDLEALARALAALDKPADVHAFLEDLCTPAELEAMCDRWKVVPLLVQRVIEAAVDLCGFKRDRDRVTFVRDNEVTLVIRSDFKGDLKLGNKINVFDCIDAGRLSVSTTPVAPTTVLLFLTTIV